MDFGDLKSQSGLQALNKSLEDRSYTEGLPGVKQPVDSYGPASSTTSTPASAPAKAPAPANDDDDLDLFGDDDEEDDETKAIKAKRLEDYAAKKATQPVLIAKSNIILDVKPWDDTTDMAEIEKHVRTIQTDGLIWGTAKLVPVGYGIKKLQISCVVEDDKVSTDFLEEEITKFDELVQSVDIAAFNKTQDIDWPEMLQEWAAASNNERSSMLKESVDDECKMTEAGIIETENVLRDQAEGGVADQERVVYKLGSRGDILRNPIGRSLFEVETFWQPSIRERLLENRLGYHHSIKLRPKIFKEFLVEEGRKLTSPDQGQTHSPSGCNK